MHSQIFAQLPVLIQLFYHIYKKNSSDICNQVARNTTHAYETNPWDISAQPKYKKGLDFSNLGIGDYKGCYYEIEPVKVNNNTNLTAMSNQLYSYENKLPYKTDQNMYYAESSSAISNKGITNILPPPPIWTDSGGKTAALISDSESPIIQDSFMLILYLYLASINIPGLGFLQSHFDSGP